MATTKKTRIKADLDGMQFHRLFVKHRVSGSLWLCTCSCGKEINTTTHQLRSGKTKSCGCLSRERVTKHGMEGTPTYNTWAHMLSRCRNSKHKQYSDYGGRGIEVCDRWLKFENFFADMGEKPDGLSLDRVDNDGNYEPSNCRWASDRQQVNNRRNSPTGRDGKSLAELAREHGLPWRRVFERVRSGWDVERALNTPIRKKTTKEV